MRRWSLILVALLIVGLVPAWAVKPAAAAAPFVSIEEIQGHSDSSPYEGDTVTTAGIVTGIAHWKSYGKDRYGFFLQNGTGPWKGIFVYTYNKAPAYDDGTPLKVGDRVKVTGEVQESHGQTQIGYVSSITSADGISLETPEPVVIPTGNVSQEQWEGVLVEVKNVNVTEAPNKYGEWKVDDGSGPAIVDDLMYSFDAKEGQHLKYVIGPVYYSYGNFKIEPRSADDIGIPPVVYEVSIQEIQSNATSAGDSLYANKLVKTEGVVTFVSDYGFAIQNGSGAWSGIWVYTGSAPSVSVGDLVEVQALVKEHYHFTEINYKDTNPDDRFIKVLGTAEVPEPVVLKTGEVSSEKWEGVLVEVRNVKVTNANLGYGEWQVDDGSGPIRIDDKFYKYQPEYSKYVYIRGIVWFSYGNFKIEPRDAGDIKPYKPNINSVAQGLIMHYTARYAEDLSDIQDIYQNFTATLNALEEYNVTFDPSLQKKIDEVSEAMAEFEKEYTAYLEFMQSAEKSGFYLPAFIHIRNAVIIGEKTRSDLVFLTKLLQKALEELENQMAQENQGGQPEVLPAPSNETGTAPAENATAGNATAPAPSEGTGTNITIKLTTVLIDDSHGQYYIEKAGISGLVKNIEDELGWDVTINTEPLTYDLLKDYDVVIILDPSSDYTPEEISALQEYVENGGGLFIAGEWYKYANTDNFNAIVGKYGITFNNDELMDDEQNSGRPYYPFVGIYNRNSPITRFIPDGWKMYYNGQTLSVTGDAVWVIRGFDSSYSKDSDGNILYATGSEPVVAAAVQVGNGRIVVYGSSKAFSDSYSGKYIQSNWPFIKGALLWLAHEE